MKDSLPSRTSPYKVKRKTCGICLIILTEGSSIHPESATNFAMFRLAGRPEFDAVYVAHPIQDQTRAEIEVRADAACEEIVARG